MKAKRGVICSLGALVVLLAVVVVAAQWDAARAAEFNPTLTVSVSDDTAGANADLTSDFSVPAGGLNYNVLVDFRPVEFEVATDVPIGAYVGSIEALATLGLLNNPCETALPVTIPLLNGSVDTSDTLTYDDSYVDLDGNTVPDGAEKYPDLLTRMFPGMSPTARMFGVTSAAGSAVTMNVVIFEPGATLFGKTFDASLGRAIVWVLNDIGDPGATPAPNPITDFCAPLSAKITTFGISKTDTAETPIEGGDAVTTNPTAGGDYVFTTYAVSNYDADDDGLENGLDTCPYDVNTGQDGDNDGLDDACDPDPAVASPGLDEDGDAFMNAGDNCPLVANGTADADNQGDGDTDSIGDACDQDPATPDGVPIEVNLPSTVTIVGEAAPAETPEATAEATPEATPEATAEATPEATPEATAEATPAPTPTPAAPEVGGAGLLGSDDGGFPVWAIYVIGVAAVLMLGGIGTMATVAWRRRR